MIGRGITFLVSVAILALMIMSGFGFAQTSFFAVGGAILVGLFLLFHFWGNTPDEWYGWNGIPALSLGALWLFCWRAGVTFPAHTLKSMLFVSAVFAVMCYLFRVIVRRLRRNKYELDPRRKKADDDHDHSHGH